MIQNSCAKLALAAFLALTSSVLVAAPAPTTSTADIRTLNQHFSDPSGKLGLWTFGPRENIREISTDEHEGLVTIREAGKGQDIKGLLENPIRIADYSLPWEFQVGAIQCFDAMVSLGSKTQSNYAIGMNVAVTASDPATWSKDRTQRPNDTKSFQLFVVHLGNYGEPGIGLPQYSTDAAPDTFLVVGRGDLGAGTALGDWRIPYVWIGDGAKYGGPSSNIVQFRCVVVSPTKLRVGVRFDSSHGWNMRDLDLRAFGPITGIWEIGPIISGDRWIPDVLCQTLPVQRGTNQIMTEFGVLQDFRKTGTQVEMPAPLPPDPRYEYYFDYLTFQQWQPPTIDAFSDDFDIPGYMGPWQIQEQGAYVDAFSHPGQLQWTLLGPGSGACVAPSIPGKLDLSLYPPPWEVEVSAIPPPNTQPWNINFILNATFETTGSDAFVLRLENDPDSAGARFQPRFGKADLRFTKPLPDSILNQRPLTVLFQVVDSRHVRCGIQDSATKSWHFSEPLDVTNLSTEQIANFGLLNMNTLIGRGWGWKGKRSNPAYQQFLIDSIRYRPGLSR